MAQSIRLRVVADARSAIASLEKLEKTANRLDKRTIKINVDKRDITDTQKRLNNLTAKEVTITVNKAEITKAQKKISSMRGKRVKIEADSTSIDKAREKLEKLDNRIVEVSAGASRYISRSNGSLWQTSDALLKVEKNLSRVNTSFIAVLGKVALWSSVTTLIYAPVRAMQSALATMKEVDSALVDIQKVTDLTDGQIKRLTKSSYELASAMGRTADEVLNQAVMFARAGYQEQIEDLAELGVLLQNVGDIEADTASSFIIAVDAAWQLHGSTEALMEVIDGLNNITNLNATDMDKMTSGVTVAASVFATAGESVQTFAAMLGTATAATQRSGSEMARGLRTILMNIQQIRGEVEFEGGEVQLIDDESIAKAAEALRTYASIETMANGELRKTSDILADLAEKWDTLKGFEKAAIGEALAGKRQRNILDALMTNWDMYEKMLDDYANGTGSALRENELYIQSWEARLAALSSTWTEFVSHMVNTDVIKEGITLLTQFIVILDSGAGQLIVIEVGMIALAKAVQMGTVALKEHIIALHAQTAAEQMAAVQVSLATAEQLEAALMAGELSQAEIRAAFATGKLTQAQIEQAVVAGKLTPRQAALILGNTALQGSNLTLAATFKTLTAAMLASPLFWAAAAGAGIYAIVKGIDAATVSVQEAEEAVDEANNTLEETQREYDELIARADTLTAREQTRLRILERRLELEKEERLRAEEQHFTVANGKTIVPDDPEYRVVGKSITPVARTLSVDETAQADLDMIQKEVDAYQAAGEALVELDNKLDHHLITEEEYKKEQARLKKEMEEHRAAVEKLTEAYGGYSDAMYDAHPIMDTVNEKLVDAEEAFKETDRYVEGVGVSVKGVSIETESAADSLDTLALRAAQAGKELDSLQGIYQTLSGAVEEYNENGYLSVDTLQKLLDMEPEYLGLLEMENGKLTINTDALYDIAEARIRDAVETANQKDAMETYSSVMDGTYEGLGNLVTRMQQLTAEKINNATATMTLTEAEMMLKNATGAEADEAWNAYKKRAEDRNQWAEDTIAALRAGQENNVLNGPGSGRSSGGRSATASDPYKEALDALQSYLNASESKIEDWERGNASPLQVVAKYKEMQTRIHALAEEFRAKGLTDDSEQIIKLKKLWWGYFDDIEDTFKGAMDDLDDKMSYSKTKIMDWENAGGNTDEIVAEYRKMMNETHELAEWYRSMGYDDTSEYIQDLKSQWWDYYHEIEDIQKSLVDELEKAVDEKLKEAAEERDRQLDALDAEEEALKAAREQEDALLELEEKRLAVMEAQKALLDASNERTVRQMQEDGTWEWVADPRTVKEAQEQLEQAEKDLKEYEAEQAYQAALDEIDARRDAINAAYDAIEEEWDTILKSLQEPTRDIADILDDLAQNGTARMKEQVDNINGLLGKLGDYINGTISGGAFLEEGNGGGSGGGGGGGGSFRDYSGDTTDYSKKMMESTSWDEFNHWAAQRENKANAQGIDISGGTWKSNDQIKSEWLAAGGGSRPSAEKKPTASSTTTTKKTGSSSLNGSSEHPSERRTFDSGGIARGVGLMHKDTEEDEIVLGPELTKKLLAPVSDAEYWRSIEAMGWMWGNPKPASPGLPDSMRSETHNDRHDTSYYINGVQIGESEAHKPLSEILSTLALHANEY